MIKESGKSQIEKAPIGIDRHFMLAIILLCSHVAQAQEMDRLVERCLTKPKVTATQPMWSWRIIDGRKCWYAGKRMRDKKTLYWWEEQPPEPERVTATAVELPEVVEEDGERVPFPVERWWPQ
jgi:hypothetical protein